MALSKTPLSFLWTTRMKLQTALSGEDEMLLKSAPLTSRHDFELVNVYSGQTWPKRKKKTCKEIGYFSFLNISTLPICISHIYFRKHISLISNVLDWIHSKGGAGVRRLVFESGIPLSLQP